MGLVSLKDIGLVSSHANPISYKIIFLKRYGISMGLISLKDTGLVSHTLKDMGLVSSHISYHMMINFFKCNPSKKLDG
jgi:hypothetical protein